MTYANLSAVFCLCVRTQTSRHRQICFVIATARHEAESNLNFYMKKQIASVVPPSQ
ncbi:MAG: hypothetical protein V1781_00880 [Bacteroidota bacterium]